MIHVFDKEQSQFIFEVCSCTLYWTGFFFQSLTSPSCHSARRAWPELQNPLSHLAKDKLLPWEKVPIMTDERWWKVLFPAPRPPSTTVTPTPGGRGLIIRTWILRLRLRLRAEWQNNRMKAVIRKVKVFRSEYPTERKSDAVMIDWVDAVCIGFGLIRCQLYLEWFFENWLWNEDFPVGYWLLSVLVLDWWYVNWFLINSFLW